MRPLILLFIFPLLVHGEIIEIQKIEETLSYLGTQPFVLMDLDNTLIRYLIDFNMKSKD